MDRFANLWKEQFSFAHVHALAAQAGCAVDLIHVDVDSVDCRVRRPGFNSEGVFGPELNVQVKSTSGLLRRNGSPVIDLPVKNYDELRIVKVITPRILVVLEVPLASQDWILCSDGEICLRHRAYWTSLRGEPESANEHSVRVSVPKLFDQTVLERILDTMNLQGVWA